MGFPETAIRNFAATDKERMPCASSHFNGKEVLFHVPTVRILLSAAMIRAKPSWIATTTSFAPL